MLAIASAAALVGFVEIADKTMIATVVFALKTGRPLKTLATSTTAFVVANVIPALLAGVAAELISNRAILEVSAGVVFVAAGLLMLRGGDRLNVGERSLFTGVVLAEMGDKTQLTTASLSALYSPLLALLGATIGYVAVNALAVVISSRMVREIEGYEGKIVKAAATLLVAVGITSALHGLFTYMSGA